MKALEPTSLANENFRFHSTLDHQELSEHPDLMRNDKPLQSPIETHFANTPLSQSETSSPANGFTEAGSSDLLCQELDKLNTEQILSVKTCDTEKTVTLKLEMETLESVETVLSPTEENINMFTIHREDVKPVNMQFKHECVNTGQVFLSYICLENVFSFSYLCFLDLDNS